MKVTLLMLIFLVVQTASALEVKSLGKTRDGVTLLKVSGSIEVGQKFPRLPLRDGSPSRIFITSSGGNPAGVRGIVSWLKGQIRTADVTPTIIMNEYCNSSCIVLLANLNYLAGAGAIELILDEKLSLGFHGCMNLKTQKYDQKCTLDMAKEIVRLGVKASWVNSHQAFFSRPRKDYVVRLDVTDRKLWNSGLIDFATIEDNTKAYSK